MLLCSFAAHAHQPRVINEMVSSPGETKEQFVERIAIFLNGWTHYNGSEACGLLAKSDEGYSVILGTLDSQMQCDSTMIHKGFVPTGETIHSHQKTDPAGRILVSDRTRELAGDALRGMRYLSPIKKQFSSHDYKAGPGYLVTDGLLLFQSGPGTRQEILKLPAL